MNETPTFKRAGPRRRGFSDPGADLAAYDRLLAGVAPDHPGLPFMLEHRAELAAAIARERNPA